MKQELQHRIVRIVIVAFIFVLFGAMFLPFFTPLLMAALFAFALDGVVSRYGFKPSSRRIPALAILAGILTFVTFPLALIGYRLALLAAEVPKLREANNPLFQSFEAFSARIMEFVNRAFLMVNGSVPDMSQLDVVSKGGTWLLAQTGGVASRFPELVLDLFVFSAMLYVLLTEARFIRASLGRFKLLKDRELDEIIGVIQRSSYRTLVVSAVVGAVQAGIIAVGGLVFGFPEFLLLFVITFFLSFIPVIGAAPIGLLLAVLALVQGHTGSAVGLAIVALVAGSVDNVLKPMLLASSSEESLNPVVSLLAIIGAILIYGFPGILLGPILTELALKIVPILFREEQLEEAQAGGLEDGPLT